VADAQRALPNTIEAYAFDLRLFWSYLVERGLDWTAVGVMEIGEFAAWARTRAQAQAVKALRPAGGLGGEPPYGRHPWARSVAMGAG